MAEEEYYDSELSDKQKKEIAKWFLLNSPAGEIQYIAKGLISISRNTVLNNFWMNSFFFFGPNVIKFMAVFADLKSVLNDERVYNEAAQEAFPLYNKSHLISLELPDRSGDVKIFFMISFRFFLTLEFLHCSIWIFESFIFFIAIIDLFVQNPGFIFIALGWK